LTPVDDAVRLHATLGRLTAPVRVVESEGAPVTAGGRELGQQRRVDAGIRAAPRIADVERVGLERGHTGPESGRQDLLELGERAQ